LKLYLNTKSKTEIINLAESIQARWLYLLYDLELWSDDSQNG